MGQYKVFYRLELEFKGKERESQEKKFEKIPLNLVKNINNNLKYVNP